VNWTSFAVGVGTLAAILLLKPYKRIPGLLLAVIAATSVVGILSLKATAGVKVLGPLPQGLPSFALQMISFAHLDDVIIGGCAVAMVAFVDTSVLSRTYAAKTRTSVDPNQEMIGLGAANLAGGLFQGFPISSSSSRTPVAEAAGAKTQFTRVVGAIAVALLLMFAPNLLKDLPSSALAAVVIAAAIRLIRIRGPAAHLPYSAMGILAIDYLFCGRCRVRRDSRHRNRDSYRGYRVSVGRLATALRSARPSRWCSRLSRHQALPVARRIPGLVLFRWDAPLFFANAELFHQRVLDAIAESPTPVRRILTAEPVSSIDVTSADMLAELEHTLTESGIELRFAEVKDPVKDKLKRFELFDRFGAADFYPTIGSAVDAYLEEHAVDWKP
jgi:MFS superfamily sulfate permease-like transporter